MNPDSAIAKTTHVKPPRPGALDQRERTQAESKGGRRLFLSVILERLAAAGRAERAAADPPDAIDDAGAALDTLGTGPDSSMGHPPPPRKARSNISIGEIVDRTEQAGFGVMIAVLALCSMPIPGVSVPFGLCIAFGAIQMLVGMHKPWLPLRIRRYRLTFKRLEWVGSRVSAWTRGLERFVRPRFEILARGPMWHICGLGILILALGLALPLPIPYSNLYFALPLCIYAIGLLELDGLLLMVAHAIVVIDVVLIIRFYDWIQTQMIHIVQAISAWLT